MTTKALNEFRQTVYQTKHFNELNAKTANASKNFKNFKFYEENKIFIKKKIQIRALKKLAILIVYFTQN